MARKLLGVLASLILLVLLVASFGILLEGMRAARQQPAAALTPTPTAAARQAPTPTVVASPSKVLQPTSTASPVQSPAPTRPWAAENVRLSWEKDLGPKQGWVVWSPNSQVFVYMRIGEVLKTADGRIRRGTYDLWMADREGSNVRRFLQRASDPAWSLDGKSIFYQAYVPRSLVDDSRNLDVNSVNADGTSIKTLFAGNSPSGFQTLQPLPGDRLASIWGQRDLTALTVPTATVVLDIRDLFVPRDPASPVFPTVGFSFSRDGTRLAYAKGGQLWIDSGNGAGPALFPANIGSIFQFSWSPDGRRVAYAVDSSLWVSDPDGKTALRLAGFRELVGREQGNSGFGAPKWSPDGNVVFFNVTPDRTSTFTYVVNVTGGPPKLVATGKGLDALSPDGTRAVFGTPLQIPGDGEPHLILASLEH